MGVDRTQREHAAFGPFLTDSVEKVLVIFGE